MTTIDDWDKHDGVYRPNLERDPPKFTLGEEPQPPCPYCGNHSYGAPLPDDYNTKRPIDTSTPAKWNIGSIQWLEERYPHVGPGVIRVIDPDMNLNSEAVDNFDVNVWSDSDVQGIDLTVTETDDATGIFEGTVFFTSTDDVFSNRLRIAESDTITLEYRDNTLPYPYLATDELSITATSLIYTDIPLHNVPPTSLG